MKRCTKCGRLYPATKEFYPKRKSSKDGLRNECRICTSKYLKQYRQNNKDQIKKNAKDNALHNKEKLKQYQKQWRAAHQEYIKAYRKYHYAKHKNKILTYSKQWREANKDELAQRKHEYYKKHKKEARIRNHRYEAKRRDLPATLSKEQWDYAVEVFDHRCAYCGAKGKLVQEHFVPVKRGGEYTHNNIIPSCVRCNSSKSDSIFSEWYQKQSFYSKRKEQKILSFLGYDGPVQQMSFTDLFASV